MQVYWYDQAIPRPQDREYRGIGTSWVPGPLARKDLGVWYKARIIKCDATAGTITVSWWPAGGTACVSSGALPMHASGVGTEDSTKGKTQDMTVSSPPPMYCVLCAVCCVPPHTPAQVTYDVDNSQDEMYLLVAFTHFGVEPPSRGGWPVVLPDMERVRDSQGAQGATKLA